MSHRIRADIRPERDHPEQNRNDGKYAFRIPIDPHGIFQRPLYCYYQGVDPDIKALFQVLIESQVRTDKSIGELTALLASHAELSDTRVARAERAIANLAANVDKYVAAADARTVRIEENLDGLIRAMTLERSNGKGHD
jgi:hypothetical protein